MGLFSRSSASVLGIDISAGSVKLLELAARGKGFRVEAYAVIPLPPEAVVDKNIAQVDVVGEAVEKAVKKSGSKLKTAAVAVAGSAAISKVITVPANIPSSEIQAQVEVEADRYIPFPLDEVHMDYEVRGPVAEDPDQVEVLLVASRNENVESRIEALEYAGLVPKIVDTEIYAVENAVNMMMEEEYGSSEGQVIAIADVGGVGTIFNVIENDNTIYSREEAFGGNQLTEQIQQAYGLSYEEADMAKKQGGLPENYESEVLGAFKQSMSQQISRTLQFFYSSSHISNIDYLLLAGGTAAIPGVSQMVEEQVTVPTVVADPFSRMSTASRVSDRELRNDAPSLMICCGLALRSFD